MTQIMTEASELMLLQRTCAINGCGKKPVARGWCGAHYQRWWSHGDPLGGGRSPGAGMEFLEKVAIPFDSDECLIWPFGGHDYGYGTTKKAGKRFFAHRLVCEAVHGPPPTGKHYAAHSCGKGHEGCCNPRHIRWATPKENQADRLIHGTHSRGARNAAAKLTEDDVRAIRASSVSMARLAKEFGVSPSTIRLIKVRKNWAWLEDAA